MLAFRISVNGSTPVTAGFSGPNVLSFIATSVVRDPDAQRSLPNGQALPDRELKLSLGGLDTAVRQHIDWRSVDLAVGDKVLLEVLELSSVDPPVGLRGGRGAQEPAKSSRPAKPKPAQRARPARPAKPAKPENAKRALARSAPAKRSASSKPAVGKRKRRA